MPASVTVAVVSWNTREELRACLQSLAADAGTGLIDVHVVDNASGDGSAAMSSAEFPWATTVALGHNAGFGPAVNLVAERTGSPWLLAANADIALTPQALPALLDAGERDPGAGILAPRLLHPDGSTQHSVHPFPTLALTLAFNLGLARRRGDALTLEGCWDPERPRLVDWAIGACLLIRRTAFEQAGGFDPAQWMYAEDLDLAWRATAAGWHTRYVPAAVVNHAGGAATTQAWGSAADERWLRSTYAWMLRRRGPVVTRTYAALNLAGALARRDRRWSRLHAGNLLASRATLRRHR